MSHEAQPAIVQLGSVLLAAAEAKEKQRLPPAKCGSPAIDDAALEGGFRYGEITSIAGATGTGKTLLAYHAAASHLLTHSCGEVAFIDTNGSFSPYRMRDVLAFRLRAKSQRANLTQTGHVYEKAQSEGGTSDASIVEEATTMLDRVKVMRVFDLAGVVEATSEVSEMNEQSAQTLENQRQPVQRRRPNEVVDSEDELDNEDEAAEFQNEVAKSQPLTLVGMIIIDTMTNVVSGMVTKNQTQGQALLASLMRLLRHLTARQHICTLLTNIVVGMSASENPEFRRRTDDDVSIFASTRGKPALGKSFTYLIDTSIFLSCVPKTIADAMAAYGGKSMEQNWRNALVIEVLKDRCGGREGRWAAFEILGVKLVPC